MRLANECYNKVSQLAFVLFYSLPVWLSIFFTDQIVEFLERERQVISSAEDAAREIATMLDSWKLQIDSLRTYVQEEAQLLAKLADQIYSFNPTTTNAAILAQEILFAGRVSGVDPFLIAAICGIETRFRNQAIRQDGAFGLMQILPSTAYAISKQPDLAPLLSNANPLRKNMLIGAFYIKHLQDYFASQLHLVLAAYNFGPMSVERANRNIAQLPRHVRDYVAKVSELFFKFK